MKKFLGRWVVVILAIAAVNVSAAKKHTVNDPVVFSFATVGDSRGDAESALTKQDALWLQNSRALTRILREIKAQKANALFFNGDMIMGYSKDPHVLDRQYAFWRGMVAELMESGTYVVPVPGNHEMQVKVKEAGETVKRAQESSENAWRDNMGDLILDAARWEHLMGKPATGFDPANSPAIGGPDPIVTDQRQLSWSFDYGSSHFAIINTDPVGNDGHAPVNWLKNDLQQARDRGAKNLFVFGHKLAYTYKYNADAETEGLDKFPENANAFWQVIEDNGATYFCGHEHIFHVDQPTRAQNGHAWQILVGSGGSPFAAKPGSTSNPDDRTYAWAWVLIHASGRVELQAWGFDDKYGPTHLLKKIDLKTRAD